MINSKNKSIAINHITIIYANENGIKLVIIDVLHSILLRFKAFIAVLPSAVFVLIETIGKAYHKLPLSPLKFGVAIKVGSIGIAPSLAGIEYITHRKTDGGIVFPKILAPAQVCRINPQVPPLSRCRWPPVIKA